MTGLARTDMANEQQEDLWIQCWKEQEDPTRVIERNGVLLRQWSPKPEPHRVIEQLVLPKVQQQQVLKLAHDMLMTGHLGKKRQLVGYYNNFTGLLFTTMLANTARETQSVN